VDSDASRDAVGTPPSVPARDVRGGVTTGGVASRAGDPLQPQELVITILGMHLRGDGDRVRSGGMVRLLAQFDFSTGAARAALSRLVNNGILQRHRNGRSVDYVLTPRAQRLLAEGDRRIFSFGRDVEPPKVWTIIWHAIPENRRVERSHFATRLRFFGFRPLQDATWLAANDRRRQVRGVIDELSIQPYTTLFLARLEAGWERPLTLLDASDSNGLERRYSSFLADYRAYAEAAEPLSDCEAFIVRTRLMHTFRSFAFFDPELPESLAAGAALRKHAVELFDIVYRGLQEQADRHFGREALTRPD
jgi:phenylacetic acid degradation operon negative regulatory protein